VAHSGATLPASTSPGSRGTTAATVAIVAIVAIGAVVRFWGLGFGLPYTQARPDETFIISVARALLSGNLLSRFFDYPWLYMWTLAGVYLGMYLIGAATGAYHSLAGFVASWPYHWEPFFLASRALSATLGTATLLVVYRIGRQLWNTTTAGVATLFLSLSLLHVRDSHFGTTDVAVTFLIMLTIMLLVRSEARGEPPLGAAVAAGLATATKYSAVLLLLPLVLLHVRQIRATAGSSRRLWGSRSLELALAFALPCLAGVPFLIWNFAGFLDAMRALQQSMQLGQGNVPLASGWWLHAAVSMRYGMGLPVLMAAVAGLIGLAAAQPELSILLFSFPLAYYIVAAISNNVFVRYAIPLLPFACLAAAWLVVAVGDRVVPRTRVHHARPADALAWIVAAVVVAPSAYTVWQFDRVLGQTDSRVVVARWFAEHVPDGSSVLQSGSRAGQVQFIAGGQYVEWLWNKRTLRFDVDKKPATGEPDYIVLQESPLPSETQPIVTELLRRDYVLVGRFEAVLLADAHVYDRQDAFYVPLAGFKGVKRPGPNFTVYKRASAPFR